MLKFINVRDYEVMSLRAALHVSQLLKHSPKAVLGLATGSTPLGMYQQLIQMRKNEKIDFSQITTFNLDEYVGLSANHPRSYHMYMNNQFFTHVNSTPDRIHLPNGMAKNLKLECEQYEKAIEAAGKIDLQILGIGSNGHIGFNEPGSLPESRTSVVQLALSTIQANSRFFNHVDEVPKQAITMGIGTILFCCKQIILLASGSEKAEAIKQMIKQDPNPSNPASFLKRHQDVTVILDEQAAKYLDMNKMKNYYD